MKTVNKLFSLLTNDQRKRAFLLLLMAIIMAFLDMVGVASIIQFMTVLTNPEVVQTNTLLNYMFVEANKYGIETNQKFLFFLGILVFILLIISLFFKAFITFFQVRFILKVEYNLATRLLEGYLHQPYSWFLNRHSADLGKTILSEVGTVCNSGLYPLLKILTQAIVTFSLITLLIIIDPKIAFIACFMLGLAYGLFYRYIRGFINKIGEERFIAN